jgi:hypothetical protein
MNSRRKPGLPVTHLSDPQALTHPPQQTVNPRYARGPWTLATRHGLIVKANDSLHLTERGRQFIAEPTGLVVAEIDGTEETLTVLRLVAEKGPGWRGEFLPEFGDYCRANTTLHSDSGIKSYLYNRLNNLVERAYVLRRCSSRCRAPFVHRDLQTP